MNVNVINLLTAAMFVYKAEQEVPFYVGLMSGVLGFLLKLTRCISLLRELFSGE